MLSAMKRLTPREEHVWRRSVEARLHAQETLIAMLAAAVGPERREIIRKTLAESAAVQRGPVGSRHYRLQYMNEMRFYARQFASKPDA